MNALSGFISPRYTTVVGSMVGVVLIYTIAMGAGSAKFSIGQLIEHRLFNYRGVIADIDPVFQGTEEWYQQMALSRPPRDKPWYRVLVHNAVHETYVAERNLSADTSRQPVNHPLVEVIFLRFENGYYVIDRRDN